MRIQSRITVALLAAMLGWVWFRAVDLPLALDMFAGLFGRNGVSPMDVQMHLVLYPTTIGALSIGAMLALLIRSNGTRPRSDALSRWWRHSAVADLGFMSAMLLLSVLAVSSGTYSPFLYFRF
jgi:alginate O-acetyltransferase complex protein AlgI